MNIHGYGKNHNSGVTLIELIIVIAVMAVLTGILTPVFLRYVDKTNKAKDVYTADQIARAVNVAFIECPEAYDAFQDWGVKNSGLLKTVNVSISGKPESYKVHLVAASGQQDASNRKSNCFNGTTKEFRSENGSPGKSDGSTGFYGVINRELGLSTTEMNKEMIPRHKAIGKSEATKPRGGYAEVDRYRIVKRVDNGMMEIWAAQPNPAGGYPVYRLWPEPDDEYK